MSDPIQPAMELLSFTDLVSGTNSRVQHVLDEIARLRPDRAVIVGGWDKGLALQLKSSDLAGPYVIHVNDACSLNWLRQTTATLRAVADKAVLMSNFPRQCSGLNVCDAADRSTTLALFFWGPYAAGYCASVTHCLSQGGKIVACQLLVDPAQDSDLLTKERKRLTACQDKAESQAVIQGIINSLEGDQNCPAANWGDVLM
jgi:hypothetical protein